MYKGVPFQRLEDSTGSTVWQIHKRIDGELLPVRSSGKIYEYERLKDALHAARLCYDADRTSVLIVEVESNA
jgi:hypothetical protein